MQSIKNPKPLLLKFTGTNYNGVMVGWSKMGLVQKLIESINMAPEDGVVHAPKGVKDVQEYLREHGIETYFDTLSLSQVGIYKPDGIDSIAPLVWKWVFWRDCFTYPTLSHFGQSYELTTGEWHKADVKWVRDGSNGTYYWSGFHCFTDRSAAEAYGKRYGFDKKEGAMLLPFPALGLWGKWHSPADVKLAKYIFG